MLRPKSWLESSRQFLARRFAGTQGPNQDLVQAAMVGLVEAANRFDPSYGVPFAAFATKTIVGEKFALVVVEAFD